jgi:ribosomal protein S18 acetylase RimI-like enzyme
MTYGFNTSKRVFGSGVLRLESRPEERATEIRPYRSQDREAVRAICLETAYGGDEMGVIDPRLLVDLMTRAYTDFAAGSLWVATAEERVVGYLAGCLDERPFHRVQARRVVPAAVAGALGRGLLLRPALWRLVTSFPGFVAAGGLRAASNEEGHPGHLHVNLLAEARGQSVGARLVERFLEEARQSRVPGVKAVVYESNAGARRFFERMGFRLLSRSPAFKPPPKTGGREWKIVYGRKV